MWSFRCENSTCFPCRISLNDKLYPKPLLTKSDIHVVLYIEEYVQLGTARTMGFQFDPSTTIEEALTRSISKKAFLSDNIKDYGLFSLNGKTQLESTAT